MNEKDEQDEACGGRDERIAHVPLEQQVAGRYHRNVIAFFASKLSSPDAISDLAQDTLTYFVAAVHRGSTRGDNEAYLFGIARNVLRGHFRHKHRDAQWLDLTVVSANDVEPDPEFIVNKSESRRLLLKALRRIPLDSQIALELYHWEGLSAPKVAEVLELPVGTVWSRLRTGKKQLLRTLANLAESRAAFEKSSREFESWKRSLHERTVQGDRGGGDR